MACGLSNGHVTDDVTWLWKVKLVTPIRWKRNISKTTWARDFKFGTRLCMENDKQAHKNFPSKWAWPRSRDPYNFWHYGRLSYRQLGFLFLVFTPNFWHWFSWPVLWSDNGSKTELSLTRYFVWWRTWSCKIFLSYLYRIRTDRRNWFLIINYSTAVRLIARSR